MIKFHYMERKKGRSRSNRMILINSNVSKFFKKQHNNTLYSFLNRRSLAESSNSMDETFFLKKTEFLIFTENNSFSIEKTRAHFFSYL